MVQGTCSRVLALTCMAKVRQWLSSGPGLSSDMQPNSIRTLSSALHLGCGASQWMPVVMCEHCTRKLLVGWLGETNSDINCSQITLK